MHSTRVRVAKVMVKAQLTILLAWRNNSLLVSLRVEGFYIHFSLLLLFARSKFTPSFLHPFSLLHTNQEHNNFHPGFRKDSGSHRKIYEAERFLLAFPPFHSHSIPFMLLPLLPSSSIKTYYSVQCWCSVCTYDMYIKA